jgi:hypothetical protein
VRLGDELLEVNGGAVNTLSRANAIIMQRVNGSGSASGHGDFIELVLAREEQLPENVTPRSSAGHSADPDGHMSRVVSGSRPRRRPGNCCGARPTTD